jgi:hypothetical protein
MKLSNSFSQAMRQFVLFWVKLPLIFVLVCIVLLAGLITWAITAVNPGCRVTSTSPSTAGLLILLYTSVLIVQILALKKPGTSTKTAASVIHEDVPDKKTLVGLNDIYIKLSGIKTNTIVELKLDLENIKDLLMERIKTSSIHLVEDRTLARATLEFQLLPATLSSSGSKYGAVSLLATVKEALSNNRIRSHNLISVMSPVWQTQRLSVFEEKLASEVIQKLFLSAVDSFIEAWQEANKK